MEGETDDPEILALRARQRRNFLTTLLLSQGTPMLLGGDEMGRTQRGNNNGWCQDNELSWYDWSDSPQTATSCATFTKRLIRLRREHPVFRRDSFLRGKEMKGSGLPDVWWFRADGLKMTRRDWQSGEQVLGMFLNGHEIRNPGPKGEDIEDDSFLLLFNAHERGSLVHAPAPAVRSAVGPRALHGGPGRRAGQPPPRRAHRGTVISRSIVILKRVT